MSILHAMPMAQYHDGSHVGIHSLLEFERKGPEFYKRCILGRSQEAHEARHQSVGTLGHTLILEGPSAFESSIVVRPETYTNEKGEVKPWNGNANVCKAWLADMQAKGVEPVDADELATLKGMAYAVRQEPESARFWRKGMAETTIRTAMDGVPVQCRIDWLVVNGPDPIDWAEEVDLKTISNIERAPWAVHDNEYIRHRAWYRRLMAMEKAAPDKHWLLFVEKDAAHRVWVREVGQKEMDVADAKNMETFARFAKCWADDEWPRMTSSELRARFEAQGKPVAGREEEDEEGGYVRG